MIIGDMIDQVEQDDGVDAIILGTSSSGSEKSNPSIICVVCKVQLSKIAEKTFKCPECKHQYLLDYEIMEYEEDDFQSSHSENENIELEGIAGINKPLLLTADDDNDFSLSSSYDNYVDYDKSSDKIKIPKYMRDPNVVEFHEDSQEICS